MLLLYIVTELVGIRLKEIGRKWNTDRQRLNRTDFEKFKIFYEAGLSERHRYIWNEATLAAILLRNVCV